MKLRYSVFLLLISFCVSGQGNSLMLYKKEIKYKDLAFFKDLAEHTDGEPKFKNQFRHLDNLRLDSLAYISDGLKIFGYIISPRTVEKKPCIVFNRGGNRDFGPLSAGLMIYELSKIASEGYIIIASSYRGNRKSEGSDEFVGKDVNDVLNVLNVLKEIPHADTARIGMYGWSRGGLMTYAALTRTGKVKTAVIGGSPGNLFELIKERPSFEEKTLAKIIPNYYKDKDKVLKERSPIMWVERIPKIPLLILHGDSDDRVSAKHALDMSKSLLAHQIPHRLIIYENSNHTVKEHREQMIQTIIEWFNTYL